MATNTATTSSFAILTWLITKPDWLSATLEPTPVCSLEKRLKPSWRDGTLLGARMTTLKRLHPPVSLLKSLPSRYGTRCHQPTRRGSLGCAEFGPGRHCQWQKLFQHHRDLPSANHLPSWRVCTGQRCPFASPGCVLTPQKNGPAHR